MLHQQLKWVTLITILLVFAAMGCFVLYSNTGTILYLVASGTIVGSIIAAGLVWSKRIQAREEAANISIANDIHSLLFNPGGEGITGHPNLKQRLSDATEFVRAIGEGRYGTEYPGITDSNRALNRGNLSGELLEMKQKMQTVAEEEKQRSWTANGLARFSAIVRIPNKTFDEMSVLFISELVQYIKANQGAVFVVAEGESLDARLELKGCYAYGKRKFVSGSVAAGEGLVGQAYLEGDIIFMTDVPKDYIAITSGLGEALPRCIVLVPLKTHERVEGVIELASFQVWREFELDFIKKVGEILGSAINHMRITENTQRLLAESKEQEARLRTQEEELRQNLEELNATQEAVERKSREALAQNLRLNAILDSTIDTIMTLNIEGEIESVNRAGQELFLRNATELTGQKLTTLLSQKQESFSEIGQLLVWLEKRNGKSHDVLEVRRKDGSLVPVDITIARTDDSTRTFYTMIIRNISDRIKAEHDQLQYIEELRAQEEELRQNMEELEATQEEINRQMIEISKINGELDARVAALNTSTIMSESDLFGTITFVNDKFLEVSQYSREELIGKPHKTVRHPDMPAEVFKLMWQTIKAGGIFRGIVKNRKKDGTHYWVDAVISPVRNEEGKPVKYIGVRYVIEDEDLAQKLFMEQLQRLNLLQAA